MMSSIDTCSKPRRLNMMRALSTMRARVFSSTAITRSRRASRSRSAKPTFNLGSPDRDKLVPITPAMLRHTDKIELPLQPFQNIQRWHGRLMELEAWRDPWPRAHFSVARSESSKSHRTRSPCSPGWSDRDNAEAVDGTRGRG
jgi:hypothetical protein